MKFNYNKSGNFLNKYLSSVLSIVVFTTLSSGCHRINNNNPLNTKNIEIIDSVSNFEVIEIKDYPSASGIVCVDSTIFIVGDDARDLLVFNDKRLKIKFPGNQKTNNKGRVEKKYKLDFEALNYLMEDSVIWGWGSGSKYPSRYFQFGYDISSKSLRFTSLQRTYKKLQKDAGIKPQKWNIEGALNFANHFALVNRETNSLLFYSLSDWKKYFKDSSHSIEVPKLKFNLELDSLMPSIQGIKSTLSGGEYSSSAGGLFLSASVEDDKGIINDGDILGSFICFIPVKSSSINSTTPNLDINHMRFLKIASSRLNKNLKLEGVGINTQNEIYGVVDNDDGTSLLIKFKSSEIETMINN